MNKKNMQITRFLKGKTAHSLLRIFHTIPLSHYVSEVITQLKPKKIATAVITASY